MSTKVIINNGLFQTGTSSLITIYILIPLVSTANGAFFHTLHLTRHDQQNLQTCKLNRTII
jgi:hypothetical protein